jgi:hypothetical protein
MVVAPPAISGLIESAGYLFRPGGEPPEEIVAPTRDRLPNVSAAEASVLGNRELFGRLATQSMLPAMKEACSGWRPDLILREPSEYASAIVASQRGIPVAQVAISFAEAEDGSIRAAAPALENHQRGLTEDLRASPYLTRFPASLDRSPFPTTVRYREPAARPDQPLPDWWGGSDSPLVYVTFGTVVGSMSMAARVYRAALKAVEDLDVRVLLTAGRRFDLSELGPVPANTHVERWVEQSQILAVADLVVCHGGSGTVLGAVALIQRGDNAPGGGGSAGAEERPGRGIRTGFWEGTFRPRSGGVHPYVHLSAQKDVKLQASLSSDRAAPLVAWDPRPRLKSHPAALDDAKRAGHRRRLDAAARVLVGPVEEAHGEES